MLIREPWSLSTKYKSEYKKKFEIDVYLIRCQRFSKGLKFFPSEKGFDREIEMILILIQVNSRMIDILNDFIHIHSRKKIWLIFQSSLIVLVSSSPCNTWCGLIVQRVCSNMMNSDEKKEWTSLMIIGEF
jgi:hypothetical protein